MPITKVITTKNGRKIYMVDKKFVKKAVYDSAQTYNMQDTYASLGVEVKDYNDSQPAKQPEPVVKPTPVEYKEPPHKICLFCGQPGDMTRFVNLKTVYLCNEDYNTKTVGEIGQKML
jgi:hypothetical protein